MMVLAMWKWLLLASMVLVAVDAVLRQRRAPTAEGGVAGIDLSGRRILVTGATTGIGFETASALASRGAEVHVGGRSMERAGAAVQQLLALHPRARVVPFVADLGDLNAVVDAADAFPEGPLDALIANAGVFPGTFQETAQGYEQTVAVCHLAHALLIERLMPKLREAAATREARVVLVASESHRPCRTLDVEALPVKRERYRALKAYEVAKMCNVLHALELDRREAPHGVRAWSLHPGTLIGTHLGRSNTLVKVVTWWFRPFAPTLQQGAATSVYAAVHPELNGQGGGYLSRCRIATANRLGRSREKAAELWARTERLLAASGFEMGG